jgi:hypothetical protein
LGHFSAATFQKVVCNSGNYEPIPYTVEQGNNLLDLGIGFWEQGIITVQCGFGHNAAVLLGTGSAQSGSSRNLAGVGERSFARPRFCLRLGRRRRYSKRSSGSPGSSGCLKSAVQGREVAWRRTSEIAAVVVRLLSIPRGPKTSAASASHELLLEELVSYKGDNGDFYDPPTQATQLGIRLSPL